MADGYGTDVYCYDRLLTGRLVTGPEVVAQAIYRRLTTARGTLRGGDDESIYGFDLLDFVGRIGTQQSIDALPAAVEAECLKDDRVAAADVSVTATTAPSGLITLELEIEITTAPQGDAFDLTLAVSDVAVSVVGFQAA